MSAYRKGYSPSHVLIRLIQNWRKALDSNLFTGAVLMHLSKAFDCIPHNLPIAKLACLWLQPPPQSDLKNSSFSPFSYSDKMRW